jgi:hypothetical protein
MGPPLVVDTSIGQEPTESAESLTEEEFRAKEKANPVAALNTAD